MKICVMLAFWCWPALLTLTVTLLARSRWLAIGQLATLALTTFGVWFWCYRALQNQEVQHMAAIIDALILTGLAASAAIGVVVGEFGPGVIKRLLHKPSVTAMA